MGMPSAKLLGREFGDLGHDLETTSWPGDLVMICLAVAVAVGAHGAVLLLGKTQIIANSTMDGKSLKVKLHS